GEEQIKPRERHKQFDEAHCDGIDPTASVTGDQANDSAGDQGDGGADPAGEDGDATAVQHTRELVAAEVVGTEEIEMPRVFHAEEMGAGVDAFDDRVGRARNEKTEGVNLGMIYFVEAGVERGLIPAVDEGAWGEVSVGT